MPPTEQAPSASSSLRILSFGAGAIGTYIGGSLALRGHRVVFMEQPKVAEELAQRGLKLEIEGEIFEIGEPLLADSVASALSQGPYDACIFALKSYDTQSALDAILPYQADFPPIVCLQKTVQTGGGAPISDGVVQVAGGDVGTVRYVDANDGQGGTNVPKTDTAVADCTGPVISAVGEQNVTDIQAKIVWSTDEASNSVVHWGPVAPPSNTTSANGLVTSHGVTLTGLQACTVYRYSVESRDAQGNVFVDDNGGAHFVFETQGDFGNGLQPCHAGVLTLERLTLSCNDVLDVQVIDLDLNASAAAADSVLGRSRRWRSPGRWLENRLCRRDRARSRRTRRCLWGC